MGENIELSKKEAEIMNVFWDAGEPLIIADVSERNPNLNKNTVAATVKKLLNKNCLELDSVVYHGRVLARAFRPVLTKEEYVIHELSKSKMDLFHVVSTLVKQEEDLEALEQIEEMVKKYKEEILKESKEDEE